MESAEQHHFFFFSSFLFKLSFCLPKNFLTFSLPYPNIRMGVNEQVDGCSAACQPITVFLNIERIKEGQVDGFQQGTVQ